MPLAGAFRQAIVMKIIPEGSGILGLTHHDIEALRLAGFGDASILVSFNGGNARIVQTVAQFCIARDEQQGWWTPDKHRYDLDDIREIRPMPE